MDDLIYSVSAKLSGEWSASNYAAQLKPKHVASLTQCSTRLEAPMRMRVLLSMMFLPVEKLEVMRPVLETLVEASGLVCALHAPPRLIACR